MVKSYRSSPRQFTLPLEDSSIAKHPSSLPLRDQKKVSATRLSVIMPVYNEQDSVARVVGSVQKCGLDVYEIIAVDDCSSDGTLRQLQALQKRHANLVVMRHDRNRGKGQAIRTAQASVTGDVVVIQDADLEYSPREFPKMIRPIRSGIADAVFGSRYSGSELLVDTFVHYLGNRLLTTFSNIFANVHLTDMETCYKMIRADVFKNIPLSARRFGFEPEITAKLARMRARIYEVPISYKARSYQAGKKIGWRDGIAALWHILKFNVLDRSILPDLSELSWREDFAAEYDD